MIGAKIGIFQERDKNDPAELLRTQSGVPRIRKIAALPSTLPVLGLWEVPGKGPARTERQFEPQGRAQGTPQGLPVTPSPGTAGGLPPVSLFLRTATSKPLHFRVRFLESFKA